jgi:hypothetical protein
MTGDPKTAEELAGDAMADLQTFVEKYRDSVDQHERLAGLTVYVCKHGLAAIRAEYLENRAKLADLARQIGDIAAALRRQGILREAAADDRDGGRLN